MKKILIVLFVTLLVACKSEHKETEAPAVEGTVNIALSDFDAKAGDYIDQEVSVTGIVDHVCKYGGKRLLLVDDNGEVHVDNDTSFDTALAGESITLTGIVKEFRVDEAFCIKREEGYIQKHKAGIDDDETFEKKMNYIQSYRDSMKATGVDHLSFYSLDYVSHNINE